MTPEEHFIAARSGCTNPEVRPFKQEYKEREQMQEEMQAKCEEYKRRADEACGVEMSLAVQVNALREALNELVGVAQYHTQDEQGCYYHDLVSAIEGTQKALSLTPTKAEKIAEAMRRFCVQAEQERAYLTDTLRHGLDEVKKLEARP